MFFEKNRELLEKYSAMSKGAGARADFVQGGGGNTSVKLADGKMAIKASGFTLSDIEIDNGYAVLDYEMLREFYGKTDPKSLADVEAAGSDCAKSAKVAVEGLADLRPSVEAGFHSVLSGFVLHTHSVYANLVACNTECDELSADAFEGADYGWTVVPYVNPGAMLTFTIKEACEKQKEIDGVMPSVIIMKNHGIIVHDDDSERCTAIHADANRRLARLFGLRTNSFPDVEVRELSAGIFLAECDYLKQSLKNTVYTEYDFLGTPLYPDQMVFLQDSFAMNSADLSAGRCVADTKTGEVLLNMDAKKALTVAETLTAVLFIIQTIESFGFEVSFMDEESKRFIAGWESEKYRKTLASK